MSEIKVNTEKPFPPFRSGLDMLRISEIGNLAFCEECGIEGHDGVTIKAFYYNNDKVRFCHACAVRRGVA